jgi:hypothetical protein
MLLWRFALSVRAGVARNHDVFIQVKGIDSLETFGALSGDSDVTEMTKRMASHTAGRVILGTTSYYAD